MSDEFLLVTSPETPRLPHPDIIRTPTIATFDVTHQVTAGQLEAMGLNADDWVPRTPVETLVFLARYEEVMGISLQEKIADPQINSVDLRIGGTSFTTARTLGALNGTVEQIEALIPIGGALHDGGFNSVVNARFNQITQSMNGIILRPTVYPDTHSPISLNLISSVDGASCRSMVMIEGCKNRGIVVAEGVNGGGQGIDAVASKRQQLVIVDTYELAEHGSSYAVAVKHLVSKDPGAFVAIGLGSTFVIPGARDNLSEICDLAANVILSGNLGEVQCLIETMGSKGVEELMAEMGITVLLRTNGQQGARLYYRAGEEAIFADYKLPDDEIYNGNTTNAGDIFLAACLNALATLTYTSKEPVEQLREVLAFASTTTFNLLIERGT